MRITADTRFSFFQTLLFQIRFVLLAYMHQLLPSQTTILDNN